MILSILLILVCILMILVVLIQNSKGGGIQSEFGVANQIIGIQRGTEVIEKITWGLAIAIFFFCVLLTPKTSILNEQDSSAGSKIKQRAQSAIAVPKPAAPAAPQNAQPQTEPNQQP